MSSTCEVGMELNLNDVRVIKKRRLLQPIGAQYTGKSVGKPKDRRVRGFERTYSAGMHTPASSVDHAAKVASAVAAATELSW